jgi:hypothetical protein
MKVVIAPRLHSAVAMRSVRARSADEAYKKPADARNRRRPAWRPAGVPVSLQVAPACRLLT